VTFYLGVDHRPIACPRSTHWEEGALFRRSRDRGTERIAFHGDLVEELLDFVPPERMNDTIDEPWKVEDRGEKPAIALKGR
jgi:hypothetical protein